MKQEREPDMQEEYDFSGAQRLRYAGRLSEQDRDELMRRSAVADARFWFGHTLQRIQELEALIVAYLRLALDHTPESADEAAAALLEGGDAAAVARFAAGVATGSSLSGLEDRLGRLARERNWLVHKAGVALEWREGDRDRLTAFVRRIEALARQATGLTAELRESLEDRLVARGLTSEQVREKTDATIRQWVGA